MSAIGGALRLRPGGPLPTIRSSRQEWAPVLARGRPADALPDLLAGVFSLCGGAHRVAARHALRAARRDDHGPTVDDRHALRHDTLREHLRRLWLDAPRLTSALASPDPAELAGWPLLRDDHAWTEGRAWIERHVLAMPVADWLEGWRDDALRFAARWAAAGASWPARWLACSRARMAGLYVTPLRLHVHASPLELERLARHWQREPGFALAPLWRGRTAETGCWTRLGERFVERRHDPFDDAWMRLVARLADVARLASDDGEGWLHQGALALDTGEGLGWCEMARGLLIHRVRLAGDGTVADWRLIAPTEWNFHPFGPVARALAALRADLDEAQVRLLAASYDPCVELQIERVVEASHA